MTDALTRIADALERRSPPPARFDGPVGAWDGQRMTPAAFAPLALDLLTGIGEQKAALVENTRRLAAGHAAHDALLWGARGSGKSALVKATIGAVRADGHDLALVEASAAALETLPALFALLPQHPTIVFVDDLGDDLTNARRLRSLLDGGVAARPGSVRLYVTANRRHIVDRPEGEAMHARDVADDRLALADRFGLSLGFHVADQPAYLAMVEGYARAHGLPFVADDALRFALQRGSRSGRVAWHYTVEVAGREGRALP